MYLGNLITGTLDRGIAFHGLTPAFAPTTATNRNAGVDPTDPLASHTWGELAAATRERGGKTYPGGRRAKKAELIDQLHGFNVRDL